MKNTRNVDNSFFSDQLDFFTHVVDNRNEKYDVHYHSHTFYEFVYIISGSSMHQWQEKTMVVNAGDLLLICPNQKHRFIRKEGTMCTHRDLIFPKHKFDDCCRLFGKDLYSEFVLNPTLKVTRLDDDQLHIINHYINYLVNFKDSSTVFLNAVSINLLTNLILCFIPMQSHEKSHYPEFISDILQHIKTRQAFSMTWDEIYALSFRSKEHVCREFKKYTGKTLSEYIRDAKLDYAAKLLIETKMSVTSVMSEVSINSHSYFNKYFKQKFFLSPLQYRKENSIV